MELKRIRIFITIVGLLLTSIGRGIFTSKIQNHLQIVRCKTMMRAFRRFGMAILVHQLLSIAILTRRTCTGAVPKHVRQASLTKLIVMH